jgi:hypothetical protein
MNSQKWKKPNAQKHGVFAATVIIPGEDPQKFAVLHAALTEEWQPDGLTEEDAVLDIAKAMWLKLRKHRFRQVQLLRDSANPDHRAYDEHQALTGLEVLLTIKPDRAFEILRTGLRRDRIEYFEKKFPRGSFESTAEWAEAIRNDINTVLLPEELWPNLGDGLGQAAAV